MSPPESRPQRLQARFQIIQMTLKELKGPERAFGAASAAWLMAIQYAVEQMFTRLQLTLEPHQDREQMEAELEALLRGFHKEICAHLSIDPDESVALAEISFKEVVNDICHQGG